MSRTAAEWAMVGLAVASAVFLVVYVLAASGGPTGVDPLLWIVVVLFLGYIVWDVQRHIRVIRSDGKRPRDGER